MITAYTGFVPSMAVRLPDCSPDMLQQALWLAGRDFCLESESYLQELTAIDSVADQKEYTLTIPDDFDALRVFEVRVLSEYDVTNSLKGVVQDASKYDFHVKTGVLEFFVAPFQEIITGGLVVELVLAPYEDENDTQLDFEWIRRWGTYIKAGAFEHLFSMPKAIWFSEKEEKKFRMKSREGIALAIREVKTSGTTRPLRINGRGWL